MHENACDLTGGEGFAAVMSFLFQPLVARTLVSEVYLLVSDRGKLFANLNTFHLHLNCAPIYELNTFQVSTSISTVKTLRITEIVCTRWN